MQAKVPIFFRAKQFIIVSNFIEKIVLEMLNFLKPLNIINSQTTKRKCRWPKLCYVFSWLLKGVVTFLAAATFLLFGR